MKLEDFNKRADIFFKNVSPKEIISDFEKLGYEFENIIDTYNYIANKNYSFELYGLSELESKDSNFTAEENTNLENAA